MKSFLDLAEVRFSVRKYAQTPVEQEKIDSILRAAQLAPTAKNLQPQHIYVLKSPEAIAKVNEVTSRAYKAPVVFVVCYDQGRRQRAFTRSMIFRFVSSVFCSSAMAVTMPVSSYPQKPAMSLYSAIALS